MNYYIIIVKVLTVLVYALSIIKYITIKQRDKSLKLRFDAYSISVLVMIAVSNLAFILIPLGSMSKVIGAILGTVLLIVTMVHLKNIMLFSDTYMYYKSSTFLMKDISNFRLDQNRLHMAIKRQPLSFKRPLSDLAFASERFSGKRPHRK